MVTLVVDGNNIAYRSDAVLNLSVGTRRVSAIYGMLQTLRHLILKFSPCKIIVAWDSHCEFRRRIYPEYKKHRSVDDDPIKKDIKEQLFEQIDAIRVLLNWINVEQMHLYGYEADDIISYLCSSVDSGKVVIVSNDRDFLQLINDDVALYLPTDKKYIDLQTLSDTSVKVQYAGLTPRQILLKKMLCGDKSDNIPGIPGIGDRTAHKLVEIVGNPRPLDLYMAIRKAERKLTDSRMRRALEPSAEDILARNRRLMDLRYNYDTRSARISAYAHRSRPTIDQEQFRKFLIKNKFASLLKNLELWLDPFRTLGKEV